MEWNGIHNIPYIRVLHPRTTEQGGFGLHPPCATNMALHRIMYFMHIIRLQPAGNCQGQSECPHVGMSFCTRMACMHPHGMRQHACCKMSMDLKACARLCACMRVRVRGLRKLTACSQSTGGNCSAMTTKAPPARASHGLPPRHSRPAPARAGCVGRLVACTPSGEAKRYEDQEAWAAIARCCQGAACFGTQGGISTRTMHACQPAPRCCSRLGG